MKNLEDKILGCLVGGAIGDALGYPVEFMYYDHIIKDFGPKGITRFKLNHKGVAEISDDTQMTLFTANGLLNGLAKNPDADMKFWETESIRDAYLEWYKTQTIMYGGTIGDECWLMSIKDLYSRRAPGNTCMSALRSIAAGIPPRNDSKGCGGIMRVAPIALYGAAQGRDILEMTQVACEAARLTHLHPLGWLPAGLMVYVIQKTLMHEVQLTKDEFVQHVNNGLRTLEQSLCDVDGKPYGENYKRHLDILRLGTITAIELANSEETDIEAINELGQGWTGEEAWFISLYCTLRHFDSFEEAVVASVNHCGDSDSTGAITGNLIGAVLGYKAIPEYYKEKLELRDVIEFMANDLCAGKISKQP